MERGVNFNQSISQSVNSAVMRCLDLLFEIRREKGEGD